MSALHSRAARRERQVAGLLGVRRRVRRSLFERASDIETVRLASGHELVVEVKSRKRLPRLIIDGLAQATGYAAGVEIPAVAVVERGSREPIICLTVAAFAVIVGIRVGGEP